MCVCALVSVMEDCFLKDEEDGWIRIRGCLLCFVYIPEGGESIACVLLSISFFLLNVIFLF